MAEEAVTAQVGVKLTVEEYEALATRAKAENRSMSAMARILLRQAMGFEKSAISQEVSEVAEKAVEAARQATAAAQQIFGAQRDFASLLSRIEALERELKRR